MKVELRSSAGWRLREPPFPIQQTYVTPLLNRADPSNRAALPRFVQSLFAPFKQVSTCEVWVEQLIFEPTELIWYLRGLGIGTDEGQLNRSILKAESEAEVHTLLECVLGQWADFALFPSTKEFVIYADHDEYTTIFAEDAERMSLSRSNMEREGFKEVDGWLWTGPHSPGKIEEGN